MGIPISPPPSGLEEFEAIITASDAPAVVIIDRDLVRGILAYLRYLEAELEREAAEGSFW